jgi:hypothetical protein
MSNEDLDKTIPVKPPKVKRNKKAITHIKLGEEESLAPNIEAIQL